MKEPEKIGIANKQGWAAYHLGETLFVKRFAYKDGGFYPDYGSNTEVYTAGSFIEIETLAPLADLETGKFVEHVERWNLLPNVQIKDSEASVEAAIKPFLAQTSVK